MPRRSKSPSAGRAKSRGLYGTAVGQVNARLRCNIEIRANFSEGDPLPPNSSNAGERSSASERFMYMSPLHELFQAPLRVPRASPLTMQNEGRQVAVPSPRPAAAGSV